MIRRPFFKTIVSATAEDTESRDRIVSAAPRTSQFYQAVRNAQQRSLKPDVLSCTVENMQISERLSRYAILALTFVGLLCASPRLFSMRIGRPGSLGIHVAQTTEPRALYQTLNQVHPDAERVYTVHEIHLRRDIVSLELTEGKLAFLVPPGGRIAGAVFSGHGHVFATPRDRGERRSLAQFVGVPILDKTFSRAYFRFTDDTSSEIQQELEASASVPTSDPEFGQNWASAITGLNPWHSLRTMCDWLATDPLPYFYAGVDSDSSGVFDILVDSRRDEQVLLGQPHLVNGTRVYDVWASFKAADTPAKPIELFAPVDYHVDTMIADDLSLEGKTILHLKTMRTGERIVSLELSRNLAVEQIQFSDGQPLVYFQNEDLSRRDILRRGNDSLLVVLPVAPKAGEDFQLQVSYHGGVISDAGNGVEFVGEHGTWYANAGGSRFVPFDLSFRWPKRFTLVATGTETESHEDGDGKSGRWQSGVAFAVAGFNLGEYKTETAGNGAPKIQLYANRQLEDAILERLSNNVNAAPPRSLGPPVLFPSVSNDPMLAPPATPPVPSPAEVLKRLGRQVSDSIQFFEKLNGPFPFDHLDISQIPGSFGQGWPELVYLSTLAFLPSEAEARAGIGDIAREEARELMPFHEVAHQWWGNVVVSASYRDAWIEEGMANYLSILYSDSKKPNGHRLSAWLEQFRDQLTAKAPGMAETVDEAGPLSLGFRLNSSKTPSAYETIVYGKGTWVMHMLREMMRDPTAKDPDGRFRDLLRSVLTENRFHSLSTDDFERAIERRITPAMDLEGTHKIDWFFAQWVRETGIPHYKIEFQVKPHGQQFMVTGKLLQTRVEDEFTAPIPIYVARPAGKSERLGVVVTTGPETRFHFVFGVRPTRLLIDPHLTVLCRTD